MTTKATDRCARMGLVLAALALTTFMGSCALTQREKLTSQNYCPFLGSNLCAKLTPGSGGQFDLSYVNPNAQWSQYSKVLISPVTFWAGDSTTVSAADQQMLTNFFFTALQQQFSQKFQVVNDPGPGVMTIQVALDDASSATPGLRSISLVEPHARALATLKYLSTGTYPFVGSAQAEGKAIDSVTGQVLAAAVSKRVGGGSVKAADQWQWGDAENALTYWAQKITNLLASWTSGSATP